MNRSSALAEAVKDVLNAVNFSMEFTAVRSYRAYYSQKDLKTLRVTVIAPIVEMEAISRASNVDTITIDIVIQKQVDPSSNTEMDALADLVEEIAVYFRSSRFKKWIWLGTKILVPYDPEDLSEWRVFTAMIRSEYQIAWK